MNTGLLVLLIGILLIAVMFILFLPAQRKADTPADRYRGDFYRDDDRYWYGGFFYNNPDDPAMFVPKRYGMGWTVNFGNPRGRLIFIGTLLIPLIIALLGVLVPGMHASGCHTFGCTP